MAVENDMRSSLEFVSEWQAPVAQGQLLAEHACGLDLTAKQIDWFASHGVAAAALSRPYPVLTDDVVFLPGQRFEFARYGKDEAAVSALTIVVTGSDGPIDIFAWQPRTQQAALWLGKGFALGEHQIHPRLGPLEIRSSVLSWLAADRRGIVIIRPWVAWVRLWDVGEFVAEDVPHREELERLLTPPHPRARIFIPRKEARKNDG